MALNLLLIPHWSLMGAAMATVLSTALLAGLVSRASAALAPVDWLHTSARRAWATGGAFVLVGAVAPSHDIWRAARLAGGLVILAWFVARLRRLVSESHMSSAQDPGE